MIQVPSRYSSASEWYPGGQLGTDEGMSYSAETPATTNQGLSTSFNKGEDFFEHIYTIADAPRKDDAAPAAPMGGMGGMPGMM